MLDLEKALPTSVNIQQGKVSGITEGDLRKAVERDNNTGIRAEIVNDFVHFDEDSAHYDHELPDDVDDLTSEFILSPLLLALAPVEADNMSLLDETEADVSGGRNRGRSQTCPHAHTR